MNTRHGKKTDSPLCSPLRSPKRKSRKGASSTANMANSEDTPTVPADAVASESSANVTVFAPLQVPVLRSVEPKLVAAFLKERERYELEITAKQAEVPTLSIAPWTSSIDRTLLKNLVYVGKLAKIAPNVTNASDLDDGHIDKYVKLLVTRNALFEPSAIESALKP